MATIIDEHAVDSAPFIFSTIFMVLIHSIYIQYLIIYNKN